MRPDPASRGFLIALAVLAADQGTKTLALAGLSAVDPVRVLGDYLRLVLRFNEGAAFSLSWGGPWVLVILSMLAAVFVTAALFRWRDKRPVETACLGLVLGGALGNLLDRLLRDGRVIDFIDAGLGSRRWPTFNVADIAISCGAVLLVLTHRGQKGGGNA